jgi:heat shock protein HslJ
MSKVRILGLMMLFLGTSVSFAQKTKYLDVFVSPYTVACDSPNSDKQCMQVKFSKNGQWQPIATTAFDGFTYEKGFDYKLKVAQILAQAETNSYSYKLKKVMSKKEMPYKNYFGKKLVLSKIDGKDVSFGAAYATIDPATQTIYGNSGCNRFNLAYVTDKKGAISVFSGIGTLMACEQSKMDLEMQFLAAFQNQKFKISENGNSIFFTNQNTKQVVEFTIPTTEQIWSYINEKTWKLIQLDNVSDASWNAYIVFDVAQKRVNGNAGCNKFFGSFSTDGDKIAFNQLGLTRMMCLETKIMEFENALMGYLNSSNLTFDVADQTLNIYKDNKLVLMFAKQ